MIFLKSSEANDGIHQIFRTEKNQKLIEQRLEKQTSIQNQDLQKAIRKYDCQSLPFIKILPIILTLCLSGFYFGYIVVYMGAIKFQQVIKYYDITMQKSLAIGILNGVVSIGGGLGCLLTSIFLNKFSRKNSLLITGYIAFVSGCILFVPNQVILLIMRLIQGTCIGLYCTIVPMLIRELSPLQMAGTFGVLFQFFMGLGTFFCYLLGYLLKILTENIGIQTSWEGVFAFPLLTLLAQILLVKFKYPFQTPKYLILKNRQPQLPKLLKHFYHEESIQKVIEILKYNILKDKSLNQSFISQETLSQISPGTNKQLQKILINEQKVQKTPKIAFITACFMSFSQQMVGLGCIVIYGSQLVGQILPELQNQSGFIINIPQLISSLALSYLLSKYNRKVILQWGMIMLAMVNGIIGMAFLNFDQEGDKNKSMSWGYVILIGQFMYNAVYAISVGSMLWVFLPALIQPNLLPVASFMNWVSSAIVLIAFPLLKDILPNQNPGWLFIFFAAYTLFSFIIYDKSEKQIFKEYNQMKICL